MGAPWCAVPAGHEIKPNTTLHRPVAVLSLLTTTQTLCPCIKLCCAYLLLQLLLLMLTLQ